MSKPARWYHGGAAGLAVGDWLLPRSVLGWKGTTERLAELGIVVEGMESSRDRGDRTYLTWQRRLARAYASHWALCAGQAYGSVYVAEPVNPEPDPDLLGLSVQCERARIVKIEAARVVMGRLECASILFGVVTSPGIFDGERIVFQ